MKRVALLVPRQRLDDFAAWLQRQRLVHVEDAVDRVGDGDGFKRVGVTSETADARLRELGVIDSVFSLFAPRKRGFIQSFVAVPLRVQRSEMDRLVRDFALGPLYEECNRIAEDYHLHEKAIAAAEAELDTLEFFEKLPFDPEQIHALKRVGAWVGSLDARSWEAMRADPHVADVMALQELLSVKRTVHVCAVALHEHRDEALRILRQNGFADRPIPEVDGSVADRVTALHADAAERRAKCDCLRACAVELSANRREVDVLLGYWEAERARAQVLTRAAASGRIAVVCGYVRAVARGRLDEALAADFPQVSASYTDPTPGDAVPVNLTNGRLVRPMRFLCDMFGRPDYFSFDATPFLAISFLVFFGMCFGDVVYGLLLCAVAWRMARKSRGYEGLHNFSMMFFYCGISTILFGLLTGSWASDLSAYLGEGNALDRLVNAVAVTRPLDKAVALLLVCLGIGVVNQFYGIVLKGYGMVRRGDVFGAVCDAGLWLLALPGFLITVSPLFFPTPKPLFNVGVALLAVGGIGLVLTQGRKEEGLVAKIATGVVSLYGIVGGYGCVSFVGDILSYSRLLALGLTTSIVGMSFNIIADLVRGGGSWLGWTLFALVLILGHTFNFAVSILGAFVHPARLIFMEFFNRFYEGGGVRFEPLSLDTARVQVEGAASGR